jgi:hypothetical protein
MKLLTNDIKRSLPALYSTESIPANMKTIVAKFFDPLGSWRWYVVEGDEQEDGDWTFFGLVDGSVKEWGYFTLSELESVDVGLGLGIERDIHFPKQNASSFTA